jgi:ankyrin repeat protein
MQDQTAVCTLLFYGSNPRQQDYHGVSPLHIAAAMGSQGCVQELIDRGAVIEQQDCFGAPAAHYAATTGSTSVLGLFFQESQDLNMRTYLREPPLYYATHAFQVKTVKFLIDQARRLLYKTDGAMMLSQMPCSQMPMTFFSIMPIKP